MTRNPIAIVVVVLLAVIAAAVAYLAHDRYQRNATEQEALRAVRNAAERTRLEKVREAAAKIADARREMDAYEWTRKVEKLNEEIGLLSTGQPLKVVSVSIEKWNKMSREEQKKIEDANALASDTTSPAAVARRSKRLKEAQDELNKLLAERPTP